jgi:ferredoxin
MRVKVLREQCAGHALCSATAPGVYGSDEEGQVVLLVTGDIPADLEGDARAGATTCPERALLIEG